MGIELLTLVVMVVLALLLPFVYVTLYIVREGLAVAVGDRANAPTPVGLAGRLQRAHFNLLENLLPYAALVLVAQAVGGLNSGTALGAHLFLGARLVHVVAYALGIAYVRTLSYAVGVVGMLYIAAQLL